MTIEEARRKILNIIRIGPRPDHKWTVRDIGVVIFSLFVILSTFFAALEILTELGAPYPIVGIGATAAFMGAWKLVDRPIPTKLR
jgi:hypothetical protein